VATGGSSDIAPGRGRGRLPALRAFPNRFGKAKETVGRNGGRTIEPGRTSEASAAPEAMKKSASAAQGNVGAALMEIRKAKSS
jgi:hypothetical protein